MYIYVYIYVCVCVCVYVCMVCLLCQDNFTPTIFFSNDLAVYVYVRGYGHIYVYLRMYISKNISSLFHQYCINSPLMIQ